MDTLRIILLTLPLFGNQIVWSFEFSYGTPLLLKAGFSPFLTTLVWLAGPVTGLIVQPLFGSISDNWVSSYGRRKPFVVLGWFATLMTMFLLMGSEYAPYPRLTLFIAFFLLDASLNLNMAAIRAHMVDSTTEEQQVLANAWAGRLANAGNIAGYMLSTVDLRFTGFDQVLAVLVMEAVLLTVTTFPLLWINDAHRDNDTIREYERIIETVETDTERAFSNPVVGGSHTSFKDTMMKFVLLATDVMKEPDFAYMFRVQFFSWIAWFPILFYNSAWLAALAREECATCTFDQIIRLASVGMMCFSMISLFSSIILPLMFYVRIVDNNRDAALRGIWCASGGIFTGITATVTAACMMGWMEYSFGSIMIGGLGLCWAITTWIPNTLLSEYTIRHRPRDAGSLLGLNNIFVVLPQFLSIAVCSAILYMTDDFRWIFLLASVASLGATITAGKM